MIISGTPFIVFAVQGAVCRNNWRIRQRRSHWVGKGALRAVPTVHLGIVARMVGTLRFAHPTIP
jgi:hypothetical protein